MDLEGTMLIEMSDKERQIPNYLTYMWNLKKTNKKRPKLIDRESRLVVARGRGWGG